MYGLGGGVGIHIRLIRHRVPCGRGGSFRHLPPRWPAAGRAACSPSCRQRSAHRCNCRTQQPAGGKGRILREGKVRLSGLRTERACWQCTLVFSVNTRWKAPALRKAMSPGNTSMRRLLCRLKNFVHSAAPHERSWLSSHSSVSFACTPSPKLHTTKSDMPAICFIQG